MKIRSKNSRIMQQFKDPLWEPRLPLMVYSACFIMCLTFLRGHDMGTVLNQVMIPFIGREVKTARSGNCLGLFSIAVIQIFYFWKLSSSPFWFNLLIKTFNNVVWQIKIGRLSLATWRLFSNWRQNVWYHYASTFKSIHERVLPPTLSFSYSLFSKGNMTLLNVLLRSQSTFYRIFLCSTNIITF